MGKFKPPKGKRGRKGVPQGALPCVVIILGGMVLLGIALFLMLKYSGQS
jgi:hypothetical protein